MTYNSDQHEFKTKGNIKSNIGKYPFVRKQVIIRFL